MLVVSGEPGPGPLRVGGRGWGRPEPGLSSAWQTCCANAKLPTYRKFIQIYIYIGFRPSSSAHSGPGPAPRPFGSSPKPLQFQIEMPVTSTVWTIAMQSGILFLINLIRYSTTSKSKSCKFTEVRVEETNHSKPALLCSKFSYFCPVSDNEVMVQVSIQ